MKVLAVTALLTYSICFLAAPAEANTIRVNPHSIRVAVATLRVKVEGAFPNGTTFWVSFGPLQGRFGIVQLRPRGHGLFGAEQSLPRGGRADFYFLTGHGRIATRHGAAPGNPVTIIQQFRAVRLVHIVLPVVPWQQPLG